MVPFSFEHSEYQQIVVFAMQQLTFAHSFFESETQTSRNSRATLVSGSAMDLDPVELPFIKSMIHQSATGIGYDSPTFEFSRDPVAHFDLSVWPVDLVKTGCARHLAIRPHGRAETIIMRE